MPVQDHNSDQLMADVGFAPADADKKEEKLKEVRVATSRRMFDSVDTDKSGFIEADEFQRLCRKLDATMSANDIKLAMDVLDDSGDGKISFEEFSTWWASGSPEENLKQLRAAVSTADLGGRMQYGCSMASRSSLLQLLPPCCASSHAGAGGCTEPFTFSAADANAALAKDLEGDPAMKAMLDDMRAGLESNVCHSRPRRPVAVPSAW